MTWKVEPNFTLPQGYELHEDATGLYLVTETERVAYFTHYADPIQIEQAAVEHMVGRVS